MIASITIPDPVAALMLVGLDVEQDSRVRSGRRDLRRRQRRFHQQARLRKLFA